MNEINNKDVTIFLLGASMTGKTTFINSLVRKDIADQLFKITRSNWDGQTKAQVRYRFSVDPGICTKLFIGVSEERIRERKNSVEIEDDEIVSFFKKNITKIYNEGSVNINNSELIEKGRYKEIEVSSENVVELFNGIANSTEFNKYFEYIAVEVPLSEQNRIIVDSLNIDTVTIIDSKGFLDGIKADLDKSLKPDQMLNERGIKDADISVIMVGHGNNPYTGDIKGIYEPVFTYIADNMPVIAIERNDHLTSAIEDKKLSGIDEYRKFYENFIEIDEEYLFKKLRRREQNCYKIIPNLGFFNQEDGKGEVIEQKIRRKHYKQMMLPETPEEEELPYLVNIASCVFEEILKTSIDYKENIQRCRIIKENLPEIIIEKKIMPELNKYESKHFCDNFEFSSKEVAEAMDKFRADRISNPPAGLLGPRGGVSTPISSIYRSGSYGYELMRESAEIFNRLKEDMANKEYSEEESEILEDMVERLTYVFNKNEDHFSCYGYESVFSRAIMREAYDKTVGKSYDNDEERIRDIIINMIIAMIRKC